MIGCRGAVAVIAVAMCAGCIEESYTPLPCTEVDHSPAVLDPDLANDVTIRLQCAPAIARAAYWTLVVPESAANFPGAISVGLTPEPIVDGAVVLHGTIDRMRLRPIGGPVVLGVIGSENQQAARLLDLTWIFGAAPP